MRAALTFPPAPFLSHAAGAEEGDERSRGDSALASVNERYHVLRSPLSRCAGEGPGVRVARCAGEGPGVRVARSAGAGPGVRAALTFPPAPFLSPMGSGRGRVGGSERMLNTPHAMVARVRCVPNEKAGCLIRLLGRGSAAPLQWFKS